MDSTMVFFFLVLSLTEVVSVSGKCRVPRGKPLDLKWFLKSMIGTMHIPIQSRMPEFDEFAGEPKDENYKRRKNRGSCDINIRINDPLGSIVTSTLLHTYYDTKGDTEFLILDKIEDSGFASRFRLHGNFSAVETDNQTYVAWFACLYEGRRPYFIILSVSSTLDGGMTEHLVKVAGEWGFGPDELSDGSDPIVFQDLTQVALNGEHKLNIPTPPETKESSMKIQRKPNVEL